MIDGLWILSVSTEAFGHVAINLAQVGDFISCWYICLCTLVMEIWSIGQSVDLSVSTHQFVGASLCICQSREIKKLDKLIILAWSLKICQVVGVTRSSIYYLVFIYDYLNDSMTE